LPKPVDWPWEVAERDHELQNPTSPEKIRLLGDYLRLTPESHVLDIACGKGGPATILAATYGCHVVGIELRSQFAEAARERTRAAGVAARVDVRTGDASKLDFEPESFDAALCLGASFVWGAIGDAATALRPLVRPGAFVAIGEPFWHDPPIDPEGWADLAETAERFARTGFAITGLIAASTDDWDRYESLHWRALEEWLAASPDEEVRVQHERFRSDYFRMKRELLGWAIFVGRRT
jgi:SAM-dependent methyltransferase